eukprot:3909921-Amphidinium_carterae.1
MCIRDSCIACCVWKVRSAVNGDGAIQTEKGHLQHRFRKSMTFQGWRSVNFVRLRATGAGQASLGLSQLDTQSAKWDQQH